MLINYSDPLWNGHRRGIQVTCRLPFRQDFRGCAQQRIPLSAGIQYRFSTKTIYGLTGSAGPRLMFSSDDKARLLPSLRIGVYYDLFKDIPLRIGYERVGNSNGIFAQLIVYGFKVK
jgi:hypothetical protein